MFGLGAGEIGIILVILLVVVGPKSMPNVIKSVGRAMREFRRASRELRETVGIDELLKDDSLQQLKRDPLGIKAALRDDEPDAPKPKPKPKPPRSKLTPSGNRLSEQDLEVEVPGDGIDLKVAAYNGKMEILRQREAEQKHKAEQQETEGETPESESESESESEPSDDGKA